MRQTKTIAKKLRQIIVQGNNSEIQKLFDEIVAASREEFREDNDYSLAHFLTENLQKAINKLEYMNTEVKLVDLDLPKPVTSQKLLDHIEKVGISNARFIAPFKQTGTPAPLGIILSSDDEDVPTLCKITEERHKVKDHYKISLTPVEGVWYTEYYYVQDFVLLMERGIIKIAPTNEAVELQVPTNEAVELQI